MQLSPFGRNSCHVVVLDEIVFQILVFLSPIGNSNNQWHGKHGAKPSQRARRDNRSNVNRFYSPADIVESSHLTTMPQHFQFFLSQEPVLTLLY